jgi:hypothetical protein
MNAIEKMEKENTLDEFLSAFAENVCVSVKLGLDVECGEFKFDCKKRWKEALTKTYEE